MLKLASSEITGWKGCSPRQNMGTPAGGILLVDDEDVIIDVTREILEVMGYRVHTAASGREAIERIQKGKEEIQMVILDMIMPGMACGEIMKQLKMINPGLKVVLSSGYGFNSEARKMMALGAQSFLPKPFRVEQLLKKINEVLAVDESPRQ